MDDIEIAGKKQNMAPMLKKLLPDCDGQAADAVSAYTQAKMEDDPNLLRIQSQSVQMYGYVFHDINGQTFGQTLKIQWFLLNEICTDTHLLDCCGKDSLRRFGWCLDGKR